MNTNLTSWLVSHLTAGALLGGLLFAWLLVSRGASAAQRCMVIGVFLAMMTLLSPLQGHWWPQIDVPVTQEAEKVVETTPQSSTPLSVAKADLKPQTTLMPEKPKSALPTILMLIWVLGVGLLLGRFAVGCWLWRRLWSAAQTHEKTAAYELRVSERTAVPMAAGKQILMPMEWLKWPTEDQRAALEHELAHARHGDGVTRCLAALATALHWPSPFVWLAERRLRLAQEQRCDETVLASGIDSAAYGRLLMRCAQKVQRGGSLWLSPAVASMARPSQLSERIEHIAKDMPNRRPVRLRHVVLPLVMALACLQALHVRLVAQEAQSSELIAFEVKFIESATPLVIKSGKRVGEHQYVLEDTNALLRECIKDERTKTVSYPRMVTKLNHKVLVSSVVHSKGVEASLKNIGTPALDWGGTILELTPSRKAGKLKFKGDLGLSVEVGRHVDKVKGDDLPIYEGVRVRIDHATLNDGDTLVVGPIRRPAKEGESAPDMWLMLKASSVTKDTEWADAISTQRQKSPEAQLYNFKNADVMDVLRFLAGDAKLERFILGDVGEPQIISFNLELPPLDVLLHVCQKAGLELKLRGRYWVVAKPGTAMPTTVAGEAAQKLRDQKAQQYDFNKAMAGDVLRFLLKDTGVKFFALPDDAPESQRLLTFSVNDSPFGVLEALCGTLNLRLVQNGDTWYVRRGNAAPPAPPKS